MALSEVSSSLNDVYHPNHSRSDELYHIINKKKVKRLKLCRRNTEPTHRITNTANNNYYSQIRFYRQRNNDFSSFSLLSNKLNHNKIFPDGDRIKNYIEFRDKYRFVMQGQNRKLLGYGAMSAVYKVYLLKNRKKFAAKISKYNDEKQKLVIMEENRLLHRFGNGLYIKDIYDDTLNKRLIFIQPNGKDLKTWWNNKTNGIKYKFKRENCKKQEWILKKILYEILLNLKKIHDAGYIHHDIKPQNILVTKKSNYLYDNNNNECNEWINKYSFHIIDYGLTIPCCYGDNIELDRDEIRFGTFGYNAWELMKTHQFRKYNHSIDLYALGITICELIIGQHILRHHNDFKIKQENYCYKQLVDRWYQQQQYFINEENEEFNGFTEYDVYAQTLRLKCQFWRKHFGRKNGTSSNGDESSIRSIVIKQLQYNTPYTTRFKNFISNIIRDDPKRRISNVQSAIIHDLFYNI